MDKHLGIPVFLTLWLPAVAAGAPEAGAAAGADPERAPMGLVIQCPYLPPGLTEIPTCMGLPADCMGTPGDDVIWGTEDSEVIMALGGRDVVHADVGDDIVCAGPGNDAVHGGRGDDSLFGDEGSDWLFGARGKDTVNGGDGDRDILWGGPELDHLDGGPGDRDVCLAQRGDAQVNMETCEIVFPPPGYSHEKQHALPPGVVEGAFNNPGSD